jgi:hypothetical protein
MADILMEIPGRRAHIRFTMMPIFSTTFTVGKPVAIGIGIAALIGLYLAVKVAKFVLKLVLVLAALLALGLAVWWYYAAHQGTF